MTKSDIKSESQFIWKFIWQILISPITLILILLKKKEWKDLPFMSFFKFIFEPKFTITIIIINILIFVAGYFIDPKLFLPFYNFPADIINLRFHTLFTGGFLHANITHLAGNMGALFIFGRVVERKLGWFKTAAVYFGALLISFVASSSIHLFILGDNTPGIGASGALMGLIATGILLDPFYLTYELILPIPVMVIGWLSLYGDLSGVINPTQDGIGHYAHLAGFISIALIMYLIGEKEEIKKGFIINVISFGVLAGGYLVYMFYR